MARRGRATRPMREPRPVVIGAGITEKWYFHHLKNLCDYRIEVRPKYFGSDTAFDMQKWVEDTLSAGNQAICVYDMDTTRQDDTERKRKEDFITQYANNPNVILCGSMPSIEYWFLLHYEKVNRYFETSKKVIKALNKYMEFEKEERFLSKPSWVEMLLADGRMQKAIHDAEELGHKGESYTDIPKIIRILGRNSPKLKKK
jgi:hypothetical protein